MLKDAEQLAHGSVLQGDITIIGAGGAGIVMALEIAKAGVNVTLIDSGGPSYSERVQALADTEHYDPNLHPPMNECTRRQIGGTSVIWGGRVVPFDPVDFDDRPHIPHSRWPISYESILPYFASASAYLKSGRPEFDIRQLPDVKQTSLVPGLPDEGVTSTSLERWSVMSFGTVYRKVLEESDRITLIHGLTCTEILSDAVEAGSESPAGTPPITHRVRSIRARTLSGKEITLKSRRFVLAAGGLNVTRLLLASKRTPMPGGNIGAVGNHSDQLGRYYMGHISGRIAEVRFTTPPRDTVFGFDRDEEGVYARRRLSFTREFQHQHHLANISSWLVNPEINNPAHGNGVLSFSYLILSSPLGKHLASEAIRKAAIKGAEQGSTWAHVLNMLRDAPRTLKFIPTFGYKRFLAERKVPGFFQFSRSNVYTLHYFGEQMPNPDSRVTLADDRDEVGMPRIKIDLRYTQHDVRNVLESHRLWDEHLRKHRVGELRYIEPDLEKSIWEQAGDGFHQVGSTRMSERPQDGVVGPNLNVHGYDDLFIASSSTFVTASQANSMYMILVLAIRLAEHLKNQARS